jgi:hypothetical protein
MGASGHVEDRLAGGVSAMAAGGRRPGAGRQRPPAQTAGDLGILQGLVLSRLESPRNRFQGLEFKENSTSRIRILGKNFKGSVLKDSSYWARGDSLKAPTAISAGTRRRPADEEACMATKPPRRVVARPKKDWDPDELMTFAEAANLLWPLNDFEIITRSRSVPVAVASRSDLERLSVALASASHYSSEHRISESGADVPRPGQ